MIPPPQFFKLLAIDPGTTESAVLYWDGTSARNASIMSNEALLAWILSNDCPHDLCCIEMLASYGMPVGREVFETCVWIGRFYEAWRQHARNEPRLVYRRDVKMHHCGTARAKDGNIRQALIDKYGEPGTKKAPGRTYGLKSHLWAAFALATFVSETTPPSTIDA